MVEALTYCPVIFYFTKVFWSCFSADSGNELNMPTHDWKNKTKKNHKKCDEIMRLREKCVKLADDLPS